MSLTIIPIDTTHMIYYNTGTAVLQYVRRRRQEGKGRDGKGWEGMGREWVTTTTTPYV
jgi:hypothetical protein